MFAYFAFFIGLYISLVKGFFKYIMPVYNEAYDKLAYALRQQLLRIPVFNALSEWWRPIRPWFWGILTVVSFSVFIFSMFEMLASCRAHIGGG